MSAINPILNSEGIDHDESIGQESDASIHTDVTWFRDDVEEIAKNIPFAGGDGDYSILSVLFGLHSIGGGIFSFLTMIDSNKVRVQCVECRQAVMDFPWMDDESKIKGSVKRWREAFPVARAVNVSERSDIVDADFVHIRGGARVRLHTVNMRYCYSVTDAAFVYLRGIYTLKMRGCYQETITNAAFVQLRGIHTLDISHCHQLTITDAAFIHLRGIHTLDLTCCTQINDAAFVHLRGVHTLCISGCHKISGAAFAYLRGINTFDMSYCSQTITAANFEHLRGIHILLTHGCSFSVQLTAESLLKRRIFE
jgi:hypothetical protein